MDETLLQFVAFLTLIGVSFILFTAWRTPTLSRPLVGLLIVYFILFNFLPIVLSLFLWDSMDSHIAPKEQFLRMASIETASLGAIIFLFVWFRDPLGVLQRSALYRIEASPTLVFIATVITGLGTAFLHLTELFGVGYQERNAFAMRSSGSSVSAVLTALTFVVGLSFSFVCAAAVTKRERPLPKWMPPLFALVILYWVYARVVEGSRVALLLPILLLVLHAGFNKWSRAQVSTIALVAGPVAIIGISVLTIALGTTRNTSDNALEGVGEFTSSAFDSPDAVSNLTRDLGNSLTGKLDSFSAGAMLVETYGPGDGGLQTYTSVALALVPSFLYSGFGEKPVPGSSDGTYAGLPSRIMAHWMRMDPDSGNVGVSLAAVAIWQLGYLNLISLVILNAVNLLVLNTLLQSQSSVSRGVALAFITLPVMTGMLTSPDVILLNLQRLALLAIMIEIAVTALQGRVLPGSSRSNTPLMGSMRPDFIHKARRSS